ncbi:hypothetical protein PUR59_00420 [Streptomyces sp. SP18ES09]|uniref:hypothetical protein n=1 Tax=Streptomyces sp. SP18ES09 TaxID=3002532 RepID=UPI002E77CB21|nr:hypothetical protein [Streptomyces sp. SP18ES09]MEE1813515.1 hypothetical protein [Streptomyces sp. SP18ES09]
MPELPDLPELPELPEAVEWWDQVSAWGTLGAVIVALFVAVNEGRRRRLDKEDADAGQARLVTVHRHGHGFVITNRSGGPIFTPEMEKAEIIESGAVIWESGPHRSSQMRDLDVLGPGEERIMRLNGYHAPGNSSIEIDDHPSPDSTRRCTFTFTDAQGLRWRRVNHHQPKRVLDERHGWRRLFFWQR